MHTISYVGMNIITDYDYHANQLWIAARYFESIVLLISFILIKSEKHIKTYLLVGIYTAATSLIMLSIFKWHIFPICFIEGVGQTPFKIISEYIIIAILLAAILFLRKNRDAFDKKVYTFLLFSLLCTIASEFCFTNYISNYGFINLLGHYFKIFSFYFIYRTIIQTGIREPYDLIFREMKHTEEQLYEQNSLLSDRTIADGLTIKEHMALLQQQYKILNRQSNLLDLSHEAIFAWDLYGSIFYWNKGAELTNGQPGGNKAPA
jgi:PAS domain-containing protein